MIAIESSLPANSPTKHQVVDIGILEAILNTKRTIAKSKSTSVASGTSLTLDFSSTTYWIFSPPWYNISPRPKKMKATEIIISNTLRDLGRNTAILDMSC